MMDKQCECCWDWDNSIVKGVYRKEYDMYMCIGCLKRTKAIENKVDKTPPTVQ